MGNSILIDANVILDFLLTRHESAKDTAVIIQQIEAQRIKGYLTVSIIQILGYWLTKEWGDQKAKGGLLVLLNHFEIIDGNRKVVITALSSSMTDIEDALQYQTAIHNRIDVIVSRDKKFIQSALPTLPIYHPTLFVENLIK